MTYAVIFFKVVDVPWETIDMKSISVAFIFNIDVC